MTNRLILYIGEHEAGEALAQAAESSGDYVYRPEHLMQALGIYITYLPHVVIIDMAVDYAAEAYEHLCSVEAEPMILLTDDYVRSAVIFTLPRGASAQDLLALVERAAARQQVPNGLLRYA